MSAENAELHAKIAEANAKIQQLNGYIATIRQHTIGFILEQMNTLQPYIACFVFCEWLHRHYVTM